MKVYESPEFSILYLGMLRDYLEEDLPISGSRLGIVRDLGPRVFALESEGNRICILKGRRINPFFAMAEASWVLAGRNDVGPLSLYVSHIADFADEEGVLRGAYGFRARKFFGKDQFVEALRILREDPESRRVVILLWDASDLGADSKDVPCNVAVFVKKRGVRLDLSICNRSNDLYLGVPYDVVTFSVLHRYLACALGLELGAQVHFTDSLHVYESDRRRVEEIVAANDERRILSVLDGWPVSGLTEYASKDHDWLISNPELQEEVGGETALIRSSYIKWRKGLRREAIDLLPKTDLGYAAALWYYGAKGIRPDWFGDRIGDLA